MELASRYQPANSEDKWYAHWMEQGYFYSIPDDREPFSIVIPPPNVTGVLHMGHILNNTIQDVLIRKARMEGKNACWVPGTDHASIATEAKVVRWLREEKGLKKGDLTREEFMQYAWQWTDKYGGIILNQLRKLGASCDWKRTAFTMDEPRSEAVFKVFIDLYRKGKLYRDYRMVNWDPEAKTVLSNEEVIFQEENATLYFVNYPVIDLPGQFLTIATQRPETIMGDTAVAVHPDDQRYNHLAGKKVMVPMINREVSIIFDEYVDPAFGTGALKVTPAHDSNDYELGKKHGLEIIDTLNDDGTLNAAAQLFVGKDRFEARKLVVEKLKELNLLQKTEEYKSNIGRSERTQAVVEPKLSLQWYVDMKKLAPPALNAVMKDDIVFIPEKYKNVYKHWMENIRDWCISRQLWWGHRIPAWYLVGGRYEVSGERVEVSGNRDKVSGNNFQDKGGPPFVAETVEEALELAKSKTGNQSLSITDLKQDEDVLDTWFSSWLWPITVFNGFRDQKELNYYYPTSVLVTGWDIIFLWVARMIMSGYEWQDTLPFKTVYFTGMVKDKLRRKMSKSLGNSPDCLKLIADFGADAVRYGILASSPAGGDLLFDEKLCENGRNFCNKIWNATRLVKGWQTEASQPLQPLQQFAIHSFSHKWNKCKTTIHQDINQFRLSDAITTLYSFVWDDFCSWYLEMVKPEASGPMAPQLKEQSIAFFEEMLSALHPFMPFITEELWHQLTERKLNDDCIKSPYPGPVPYDEGKIKATLALQDIIRSIREIRNKNGISLKEALELKIYESDESKTLFYLQEHRDFVVKFGNLVSIEWVTSEVTQAASFISGTTKYFLVLNKKIDAVAEKVRLEMELAHAKKFIQSIQVKLENEKFIQNAKPDVIENEKKKLADGLERLKNLEESLIGL
ncbi:MAG: valine--tRNA ligase [Saprospiraceae bacterium]|nr:valine--tRNA ligase [Saprospiraceae bacterium]